MGLSDDPLLFLSKHKEREQQRWNLNSLCLIFSFCFGTTLITVFFLCFQCNKTKTVTRMKKIIRNSDKQSIIFRDKHSKQINCSHKKSNFFFHNSQRFSSTLS